MAWPHDCSDEAAHCAGKFGESFEYIHEGKNAGGGIRRQRADAEHAIQRKYSKNHAAKEVRIKRLNSDQQTARNTTPV